MQGREEPVISVCKRCGEGKSYRPDVVALFERKPLALQSRTSILENLIDTGACCQSCTTATHIGSLLYHLRQDGLVERVGRGRFRYSRSDVGSPPSRIVDGAFRRRLPGATIALVTKHILIPTPYGEIALVNLAVMTTDPPNAADRANFAGKVHIEHEDWFLEFTLLREMDTGDWRLRELTQRDRRPLPWGIDLSLGAMKTSDRSKSHRLTPWDTIRLSAVSRLSEVP